MHLRSSSTLRTAIGATAVLMILSSCESDRPVPTTVSVDPRIELMGVIQYLDGYMLSTNYDFAYKNEVEDRFSSLREHEAVTLFHTLAARGFSFDVVPKAMLLLSDPPRLRDERAYPDDVLVAAGGRESLDRWVEAMRDFASRSDFMTFFEQHRPFYDSLTASATPTMNATVDALEDYLGANISDAHLILGVMLHHGGFSALFQTRDERTAYVIIGPAGGDGAMPGFGAARRLGRIAWHEFSHTVVNGITAQNRDWLEQHEELFEPIREDMARRGYSRWETVVNEHIIRAITARMLTLKVAPPVGQTQADSDVERGFRYIPALVNALQRYEQNRDTYQSISDFYPELLDAFGESDGD